MFSPQIHNAANAGKVHARQCQIVSRAETDYAADSRLGLRLEEAVILKRPVRRIGTQCGKVVVEDEGVRVGRIDLPAGAFVAGAEIAGRVVLWQGLEGRGFRLALPRASHSMGRDKYPLSGEQIAAPVRMLGGVKWDGHTVWGSRRNRGREVMAVQEA